MKKILFINSSLMVGGGEKLMFELILFTLSKGYKVDVLITNNFKIEYYDKILTDLGVKIHRISTDKKKVLVNPYFLKWYITLKFLLKKRYSSTIIMNLVLAGQILKMIKNPNNIHVWHISNIVQYGGVANYQYPYDKEVLNNENLTLWLINKYQKEELTKQYGDIKCKISEFKLFLNNNED